MAAVASTVEVEASVVAVEASVVATWVAAALQRVRSVADRALAGRELFAGKCIAVRAISRAFRMAGEPFAPAEDTDTPTQIAGVVAVSIGGTDAVGAAIRFMPMAAGRITVTAIMTITIMTPATIAAGFIAVPCARVARTGGGAIRHA